MRSSKVDNILQIKAILGAKTNATNEWGRIRQVALDRKRRPMFTLLLVTVTISSISSITSITSITTITTSTTSTTITTITTITITIPILDRRPQAPQTTLT